MTDEAVRKEFFRRHWIMLGSMASMMCLIVLPISYLRGDGKDLDAISWLTLSLLVIVFFGFLGAVHYLVYRTRPFIPRRDKTKPRSLFERIITFTAFFAVFFILREPTLKEALVSFLPVIAMALLSRIPFEKWLIKTINELSPESKLIST